MEITLSNEFLEHIILLGKSVPKGPWGHTLNCEELFMRDFPDWGEVYANILNADGSLLTGCIIARANTNLISEKEKQEAWEKMRETREHTNPGLSGKIAEYIAQFPPDVTTAMAQEILCLRAELATARKHLCA